MLGPSAGSPGPSSTLPLPRFEVDEFAAAFVAANQPSAKTRRMDYIAKAERETDPERKLHLLKAAEDYGPGSRYADCVGGRDAEQASATTRVRQTRVRFQPLWRGLAGHFAVC